MIQEHRGSLWTCELSLLSWVLIELHLLVENSPIEKEQCYVEEAWWPYRVEVRTLRNNR